MNSRSKSNVTMALAALAVCLAPPRAFSGILAQETFDSDTLGALSGQGGGIGWSGDWTAPGAVVRADVVDTTGSPLSFGVPGGGLISGGSRALEVQLSGAAASQFAGVRTLATPLSQTFYVAYLARYTGSGTWAGANNTFTLHLGTNATQAAVLNFGLRGDAGGSGDNNEFLIRYGTGGPVSGASTGGQLVNDTAYYLVAQVNWDGSAFSSANLWLNPSFTDNVDAPNGDATLTGFSFANPITHLFWREAVLDADDILRADQLTLGTAWTDVVLVPEPSAVAVAALGGLLLACLKRRK